MYTCFLRKSYKIHWKTLLQLHLCIQRSIYIVLNPYRLVQHNKINKINTKPAFKKVIENLIQRGILFKECKNKKAPYIYYVNYENLNTQNLIKQSYLIKQIIYIFTDTLSYYSKNLN